MKGLRIGPKLISGFAICVILSAIIGIVAVVQLARIKKDTVEIKIAENIEKEILECRRQEKNIMLFGPYESAILLEGKEEKSYLEKINGSLVTLKKLVVEGKKIAAEEEEEFNRILVEVKKYETFLKEVEVDYKKREEVIQNLETNLKEIQEKIQSKTVPTETLQFILEAHEQLHHYLSYHSSEYIARVKNEIMALKKVAEDENTIKFADEFLILFNHLVKNTEVLDNHILSMRKNAREIHRIASKITGIAEKRIDSAHKTARNVVWITLIFAVVFGGVVGIFLSRNITNPIRKLSAATDLIAKGDLTQRLDIKSNDEIGELATSFNKMTGDLKTSRDELLSAKDYTDNIIKSMIDTLIVVDPNAKIKSINKATSLLLGYTEEELIGKLVATIFAAEEEESIFKGTRLKKLIQKGSIKDYDLTYKTKDGEKIPVSFSGSVMRQVSCPYHDKPIDDCPEFKKKGLHCEKIIGIVGIAHDMREIKRLMQKEKEFAAAAAAAAAERKRAQELQKAYEEIQQKTKALEKAKEEIESFSKGLEEKVKARTMELSILYEVSNAISYTLDYQTLLKLIMESLFKIVDYDICASLLFDARTANITLKPAYPKSAGFVDQVKNSLIDSTSTLTGENIRKKHMSAFLIPTAPDAKPKEERKFDELRSFFNVPFVVRGKTIGMINVSSCKESAFSEDDVKLIYTIANQASNAIERLQAVITAEKSKMESMVESMIEGVIMIDERGEIVVLNPQGRCMLGFNLTEEITSKQLTEKMKVTDLYDAFQECQNEQRLITKDITVHQGEESAVLRCDIAPVKKAEGGIIGIVTILRDVTREKEIDRMKTDFVSIVSHELRTPLTTIREVVSQVFDGLLGETTQAQREFLLMCLEDVDRLKRIIDSLLDISKIEAGKLEVDKEMVDIVALAYRADLLFIPKANEKGIEIKTTLPQEPIQVYIDKDKIIQVFSNLLGNAIKFTEKGYVEVLIEDKTETIECSIFNTGRGISKEDLPKVFSKFQQFGRTDSAGEKGTGLGLSISKGIIDLHGGKIWVESELNKGTKFTFNLPKYDVDKIFYKYLNNILKIAEESKNTVSIVLVKIANYEKIKEVYKKEKTTEFYAIIESLLKKLLRGVDKIIPRYGRREIIVILPETNEEGANIVKKRINETLGSYQFGTEDNPLTVICNYGVATYPIDGTSEEQLLEKAEADLQVTQKELKAIKKILIVDDEPDTVKLIRQILVAEGYRDILEASSGEQALEIIKEKSLDLIILDMKLPGISGYEVIGYLKTNYKTSNIPIVIVTGFAVDSDRLFKTTEDRITIIPKPFEAKQFINIINKIVESG